MRAKQVGWILVGAAVGILVACSGSSSAETGLTQSQVQTMITAAVTPLQQQIAALQSQVRALQGSPASQPAVYITAPNAKSVISGALARSVTRATSGSTSTAPTSTCTGIGTLTGRPPDSDPLTGSIYSGISCTGYLFAISGATSTGTAQVQPLPLAYMVAFEGADCTGSPYLMPLPGTVSLSTIEIVVQSGFVFTTDFASVETNGFPWTPAYYYVPQGESPVSVTAASYWVPRQGCLAAGAEQLPSPLDTSSVWLIQPNDPSVTGVPSAPIPGPVLISN